VRITRSAAIGAGVAVTAALALPLLALPASASGTAPPWEPDPNALGTLTFYNSSGQPVTSGSNLAHLFDYAEASTTDPDAGTKATLYFGAPAPNVLPANWYSSLASAASAFPNSAAPAPLNTSPDPVATLGPDDADLTDFIGQVPAQTQSGYADVFQIRLATSGPGGVGTQPNGQYWDADVMVNPTAGTWTEVYPTSGTTAATTTTVLTASPANSAQQGTSVTLTATVTAADSTTPAGTVDFEQGGFPVGTGTLDSSGVATLTTSNLLPSAPSGANAAPLSAVFTPTTSSAYTTSTGTLAYVINPVANVPTISGAHQVGQKETCSDGSLDFGVTASYTWLASGKSVGTGASLVVPGSAYKKSLTCQVTVHDGTGPNSAAKTSKSATVSLGKAPRATKAPTLSGAHRVGKTETVKAGTWSVRGVKFRYQWLLNGKVIKRATKSTLKLAKGDKGKKISCRVTAYETGYANGVATTKTVKVS
jgi:Bacterial Ig-like domain (group 3)